MYLLIIHLSSVTSDGDNEADSEENDAERSDNEENGVEEATGEARRTGPPKKRWLELGSKQKKRRSQSLLNVLKETSEESGIAPVQMVGALLHRYF